MQSVYTAVSWGRGRGLDLVPCSQDVLPWPVRLSLDSKPMEWFSTLRMAGLLIGVNVFQLHHTRDEMLHLSGDEMLCGDTRHKQDSGLILSYSPHLFVVRLGISLYEEGYLQGRTWIKL